MKKVIYFIAIISLWSVSTGLAQTDITNLGGTISAQYSDSPAGEDIAKVIDNQSSTKYLTFHSSAWIQFRANSAAVVTSYAITSANDAPERDPLNWSFQGSTNGTTWVTLNTQSNQDFPNRFQRRTFSFTNSTAYSYYRLQMTNNSGTILQLAEWEIMGSTVTTNVATVYQHCSFGGYAIGLATGTYTLAQLQAKGILNNDLSSIRVTSGYKATLYDSDNFTGASLVKTADDACLVDDSFNDRTTSVKVEANTTGGGDWSNFVYPTVVLDDQAPGTRGSNIFHTAIPDPVGLMRAMCLEVCKKIYTDNNDQRVNFTRLNLWLEDNDGVAAKWGSPPEIWISVSVRHIANVYDQNGGSYTAVANEIKGILAHEGTHGYQWEPKNAGGYQSGTDFYGFIEGLADYVRISTIGFQPPRYPRTGGHWNNGYETTGFFINWCVQNKKSTFAIELNHTARDYATWSWNAACTQITGQGVQALWNEYQAWIPTQSASTARGVTDNSASTPLEQYAMCLRRPAEEPAADVQETVRAFPNPARSQVQLTTQNADQHYKVQISNSSGVIVKKTAISGKDESMDISDLPKGWYIMTVSDGKGKIHRQKLLIEE